MSPHVKKEKKHYTNIYIHAFRSFFYLKRLGKEEQKIIMEPRIFIFHWLFSLWAFYGL